MEPEVDDHRDVVQLREPLIRGTCRGRVEAVAQTPSPILLPLLSFLEYSTYNLKNFSLTRKQGSVGHCLLENLAGVELVGELVALGHDLVLNAPRFSGIASLTFGKMPLSSRCGTRRRNRAPCP